MKDFNGFLGIGISNLLINLLLCHGFKKDIESVFILKCPRRMLEYYYSKVFGILERNSKHLKKIVKLAKHRIRAEETHDSDCVMTCNTTIASISNTLKKFWLQSSSHFSYIQTKYNGTE